MLYERYGAGLKSSTLMDARSFTKSLIATQVGALVQKGWLRLSDPGSLPSWRTPGDPRGKVTVEDLLHMKSGLNFPEGKGFAEYGDNAVISSEIPGDVYSFLDQLAAERPVGGIPTT